MRLVVRGSPLWSGALRRDLVLHLVLGALVVVSSIYPRVSGLVSLVHKNGSKIDYSRKV